MRVLSAGRRPITADDLQRMNIPEALWRAKVQHVPESVRETIQNYLERFDTMAEKGAGLALWGKPGVGKTGVATVIAKEARALGYTAYLTTVSDLRDSMRERRMFDDSSSIIDRCREVDVLVLDSFQATDATDHYVNLKSIEELLVQRGGRLKITILTTDITWTQLVQNHGAFARTISAYLVALEVKGEDLRTKRGSMLSAVVLGKRGT